MKYALKPDGQLFDEIRIKTIPRFKESGLSGSEWRISAQIEFLRKGKVILTDGCGDIKTAAGMLYAKYVTASDNGMGQYAGDGILCDQEGCANPVKYIYEIIQDYCVGGGNCGQKKDSYTGYHRCFCEAHKRRGDQDIQDSDANYKLVKTIES